MCCSCFFVYVVFYSTLKFTTFVKCLPLIYLNYSAEKLWLQSLSVLSAIILICANLFHQMRNSRGVGADYRLARSCSSLIAHLDPADVSARVPARAPLLVCMCAWRRAQRRGSDGDTPVGFAVKCWTLWVLFPQKLKSKFTSFIHETSHRKNTDKMITTHTHNT